MMPLMRTTIDINDALLEELKQRAREQKMPLRKVVDAALRAGLRNPPSLKGEVNIPAFKVGIKPAYRGVSMNQLYDQLEAEGHVNVAES